MVASQYENARQERIKENLERMQKLGLLELSSKFSSFSGNYRHASTGGRKRHYQKAAPSTPETNGSQRRSSRLQNVTPVNYFSEEDRVKRHQSTRVVVYKNRDIGPREEVYSEEHEKRLGNTQREWVLFVDGCGQDGKRIYDKINGKSCHQCRQKTLGYRTHCSECQMVRGQFCGDCLFMRYGEHVLEALEDPSWTCPVCRGICNCSLCRQSKGLPPTGAMYRKIVSLGYKSVAHYLVQTRKCQNDEKENNSSTPSSVTRRSLPFSRDKEEKNIEAVNMLTSGTENVASGKRQGSRTRVLRSHTKQQGKENVAEDCQPRVLRSSTNGKKRKFIAENAKIAGVQKTKPDSVAARLLERRRKSTGR